MNKPLFVCSTESAEIEHPSSYDVDNVVDESVENSLNGRLLSDIFSRKFKYKLVWDAISKSEFENLEDVYLKHIDEGIPVTFTYPKWRESSSGVQCKMKFSSKKKKAGSGSSTYYMSLTVELTEIEPR